MDKSRVGHCAIEYNSASLPHGFRWSGRGAGRDTEMQIRGDEALLRRLKWAGATGLHCARSVIYLMSSELPKRFPPTLDKVMERNEKSFR
jgi:hypothetical protein